MRRDPDGRLSKVPRGGRGPKGKGRGSGPASPSTKPAPKADASLPLRLLAIGGILAAALAANLQTIRYEFLNWDDSYYILENPWIRSFSWENLSHIFTKPYFNNFLPLHLLSYSVDYGIWGLKPFGYHLHQVLLNALNAALCFLVVRRLLGSVAVAFLAGLFFAVHPSHVEAVAWVSSRKELLSTTFLLLSVYFYLQARGGHTLRRWPYLASVASFTLGLLSKLNVVTAPLFFLLVDFLVLKRREQDGRFWKELLLNKVPYAVAGIIALRLNMMAQVTAQAAYAHDPLQYLTVKGHAVWNYLVLLAGLRSGSPDYDTPAQLSSIVPIGLNLAGLVILPAVLWVALSRGYRTLALGAGWILALLLPVLVFPLVTYMAERYLYAPSLGFCWLLGAGIVELGRRAPAGAARVGTIAALAALPLGVFATRTAAYNPVWANSERLWTYAMERSQDYRVYTNLAQVRINQKRYEEAERLLKLSVKVENVTSYRSLAALYYDTQRYPEAMTAIEKASEILARTGNDPMEQAELYYTRGAIYWVLSDQGKALEAWEKALSYNPRHPQAREWVGVARGTAPK
jgi:hypothetical protein